MNKSTILFYASLASVIISIAIYSGDAGLSKVNGIFVGLWAPTLMALSNRYKEYCILSSECKRGTLPAVGDCVTNPSNL